MRTNVPRVAPSERARRVAEHWSSDRGVAGVAVFGSVARGASGPVSDTDLLVLCEGECPSRRELIERLPADLRWERYTVLCYSRDDLAALMDAGTAFSEHLRREAEVLTDRSGELADLLSMPASNPIPIREEVEAELSRLSSYSDLDVFRDNFLFVLAQVFAAGKAIVMLGLVAKDAAAFDRDTAFAQFRRYYPEVAPSVDLVERLRPFYLLVARREEAELPFPYRGCRTQVVESIDAVRALAEAVG